MSEYQYKVVCVGCGYEIPTIAVSLEAAENLIDKRLPQRCTKCAFARPWRAEKGRIELKLKWGFWPVRKWVKHKENEGGRGDEN